MASVFLSYAREDEAKAKALASALARASHDVWWDRHIHGGTEFSGAIEQALAKANVVLVLWSNSSVRSAWVRDEATEGRDSGCLVPVLLEDCRPPMGFRQLQALNLSGWNGKREPRELGELLAAIADKVAEPTASSPAEGMVKQVATSAKRRFGIAALVAALAVLALLGAWAFSSKSPFSQAAQPTLAVLPFADLSPKGDKAYFTEGVAEEILSLLAREPGIRVIGRSSSRRIRQGGDLREIRKALGVTHVLEGSARTSGDELRMSVRLLETSTGRQLWAQDYHRQLSNIFAVQDEIGREVAQSLKGTLSSVASRGKGPVTRPEIYSLYLEARAQMRERKEGPMREAHRLAREVVAGDPNYAPGQALLAETAWFLSYDNYGKLSPQRAFELARPHALRSIRIAPNSAEGYAALGLISSSQPKAAVKPLRRAIQLDPGRGELRLWLADSYSYLGYHTEALEQFRALVDMEPLWQPSIALYSVSLAAAGQYEQAEALVAAFERRGGRIGEAVILRGRFAEMRGDLSKAVEHVERARRLEPQMSYTSMLLGWYYHMLGLPGRASQMSKAEPHYTRLVLSGQQEALLREVRQAGTAVLAQPDADVAIAALARARDWRRLEQLHGEWARSAYEGCVDTTGGSYSAARRRAAMVPIQFTIALKAQKRARDASALLGCIKRNLDRQTGGPIRHFSMNEGAIAFAEAQILSLQGDRPAALQALSRAVDVGWRGWHSMRFADFPALDSLRSAPQYSGIQARLDRLAAEDRAEILKQQSGAPA